MKIRNCAFTPTSAPSLAAATVAMALGGPYSPPQRLGRNRDGICETGEFCYYFNSNGQGSVSDFTGSIDDYATTQPSCYDFKGPGAGKGKCIKNNAASAWNRSSKTVRVYFNSGYAGTYQDFAPGAKANLNATLKNQNASHELLSRTADGVQDRRHGHQAAHDDPRVPESPRSRGAGGVQDLRQERPAQRVGVELAGRVPQGRGDGRQELRLVLGAALEPQDAGGQCFDVYDHTSTRCTARLREGGDERRGGRDVAARLTRNGKILRAQYCATTTACGNWVNGDWMSQYGSRDLANEGKNYQAILRYYYRDIALS